jgi:phosphoglucomutase
MNKESITDLVKQGQEEHKLYDSTYDNLKEFIECKNLPERILKSIEELLVSESWNELNDRFHSNLKFGTGGMRGRTIGNVITKSEKGENKEGATPEYAAVGSNTLNEITVIRATKALFLHITKWLAEEGILGQPRLIIAHDVRHFSEKFCKLSALTWTKLGGYALIFDGPRSTPQLSFTVRHRYAHAGVVITASHNPFHDNGFKAYFADGGQLVPPHTEEIVKRYENISIGELLPYLEITEPVWNVLPTEDDLAYRAAIEDAVLDPSILKENAPKLVFTPIHGTGGISAIPALWDHGVEVAVVEEQNKQDPNFSSVQSPNPENPEALKKGISVAQKTKADLVLGSDPDCDRIGVAVRKPEGGFNCLTGNQVATMLAEYRLSVAKRKMLIPEEGSKNVAILKTFVTTPMISRIAAAYGVRCVNTHTGFKWMAQKLGKYEDKAITELKEHEGLSLDFDATDLFARVDILTRYSTYVVLAAEESYGYLPLDIVRDKDGNASALAIAELFAYLKASKMHPHDYLDNLYKKYGYHEEKTENLYFEGAEGTKIINLLANSYRKQNLKEIAGIKVSESKDYMEKGYIDEDEDELTTENFLMLKLENDYQIAIRPSGTEPKIKYYLFGYQKLTTSNLDECKSDVSSKLNEISEWLVKDAKQRVG